MKVLANDGISQSGIDALEAKGFEVITTNVAQEQLISYINENKVTVLLVRSATTARKDLVDSCPSLKIIGRGGVGMDNIDVAYAREKAVAYHAEAHACLDRLGDGPAMVALRELTDFQLARIH